MRLGLTDSFTCGILRLADKGTYFGKGRGSTEQLFPFSTIRFSCYFHACLPRATCIRRASLVTSSHAGSCGAVFGCSLRLVSCMPALPVFLYLVGALLCQTNLKTLQTKTHTNTCFLPTPFSFNRFSLFFAHGTRCIHWCRWP